MFGYLKNNDSHGRRIAGRTCAIQLTPSIINSGDCDHSLCQFTEAGLALQAAIQGTKHYKDDELNGN